jgi:hypothetical protein
MEKLKNEKLVSPKTGKRTIVNLNGKRFGRLLVLEFIGITNVYTRWRCICDCGNTVIVSGRSLVRGNTTSCGCYLKEQQSFCGKKIGGKNKKPDTSFNSLFSSYKKGASKRGIGFYISKNIFKNITKGKCYYCGCEPQNSYLANHNNEPYIYNGIDRIDSTKDYTEDNCVSCCKICNCAKAGLEIQVFSEWIKKVYNFWANNS